MRYWIAAISIVALMDFFAWHPTPRHWQRLLIHFRAAIMTARAMWEQAWIWGRLVWPEMVHRAKNDVD